MAIKILIKKSDVMIIANCQLLVIPATPFLITAVTTITKDGIKIEITKVKKFVCRQLYTCRNGIVRKHHRHKNSQLHKLHLCCSVWRRRMVQNTFKARAGECFLVLNLLLAKNTKYPMWWWKVH